MNATTNLWWTGTLPSSSNPLAQFFPSRQASLNIVAIQQLPPTHSRHVVINDTITAAHINVHHPCCLWIEDIKQTLKNVIRSSQLGEWPAEVTKRKFVNITLDTLSPRVALRYAPICSGLLPLQPCLAMSLSSYHTLSHLFVIAQQRLPQDHLSH